MHHETFVALLASCGYNLSVMIRNLNFLLWMIFTLPSLSQQKLVLLRPTGAEVSGLTEMIIISDTALAANSVRNMIDSTIVDQILDIHSVLQVYLKNTRGKVPEPAYLGLTQTEGGYARKGFAINYGDSVVEKPDSYYVDIHEGRASQPYDKLMSLTQLYPHELTHILYRLLSRNDTVEETSYSVNIHFFSIITDFPIAMNEGFAEHMENICRLFETNPKVLKGISEDTARIVETARRAIPGFRKDMTFPWRFGFYRASMLAWYQQFEDYKRYRYPLDGWSRYQNSSILKRLKIV